MFNALRARVWLATLSQYGVSTQLTIRVGFRG